MSAHTPGPWKVINHPRVVHVSSQRSVGFGGSGMSSVVWLTGGTVSQEANAHLIAAAPDLLAALERVLAELSESGAWTDDDVKLMREAREIGESAVAKARGGK